MSDIVGTGKGWRQFAVGCLVACATPATGRAQDAQTSSPAPDPSADILVQARRITGSAIGEIAPVTVLEGDALRALGATDLPELMKRLKGVTSSAGGGAPAILVNGRRVSGFGELQGLPPEAIERVEVLSEQDAARFGFPPTMRVMNFVLKKQFRSVELQQTAGITTDGGGASSSSNLSTTRIAQGRRLTLQAVYSRTNPILQSQRRIVPDPDVPFAVQGNVMGLNGGSIDPALDALAGRSVGIAGVPIDPAARGVLASYVSSNPAITDIGPYRTLQPRNDMLRLDGTLVSPIGGNLSGSLNLSMQATRLRGSSGLAVGVLTVPAGAGGLPFDEPVSLYRYFPDAVLRQRGNILTFHGGATVQGGLKSWTWNLTAGYDRTLTRNRFDTGIAIDALQAAVDAGGDPLQPLGMGVGQDLVATQSRTLSNIFTTKAVANGPLAALPAGNATLTVTTDYSRSDSELTGTADATPTPSFGRSVGGVSVALTVPVADAGRDVLPFLGQFGVDALLGVSQVSGYGRLLNSNIGFNWAPGGTVQVIGSINETRTAPEINQLVAPVLIRPNAPVFDYVTGVSVLATTLSGGNPGLAPEQRRITTLGVGWQPIRNREIRLNLDYIDTSIGNQVTTFGNVTGPFQAAFPDQFVRDATGALVSVDLRPVNLVGERERKLRLTTTVQMPIGRAPPPPPQGAPPPVMQPSLNLFVWQAVNYRLSDRLTLRRGLPSLDLLDGATIDGSGGRPRWDVDGTVGVNYGPTSIGIYGQLQGPTRIRNELASSDLSFSGRALLLMYSSVDVEPLVKRPWTKRLSFQLTVENLLNDRINVRDRNGAIPNAFQPAFLDPIGRTIRLGVRKQF